MKATVEVNRLALMKLINRYKGLLEWELDYLRQLRDDVVPITLPAPLRPLPPFKSSETSKKKTGASAKDSAVQANALMLPKGPGPGNLENSCVASIEPIESYEELVDVATPFVRGLAEK